MRTKDFKINTMILVGLLFLISYSSVISSACFVEGYILDEKGGGVGGANVNISIDGDPTPVKTVSKTDGEKGLGYYYQFFGNCEQGESSIRIIAYNSTHYGKNSGTLEDKLKTRMNLTLNSEYKEESSKSPLSFKNYDVKSGDFSGSDSGEDIDKNDKGDLGEDKTQNQEKRYKPWLIGLLVGIAGLLLFISKKKKFFKLKKMTNKKEV